jgi:hypothetical protein
LLTTAILLLAAGCSNNGLNLARVKGRVTYKGEPVKNGTVFFMPDEAKGTVGPPAVGSITADGSYIMSTESAGDGVIVGSHKVGITGLEPSPTNLATTPDPEKDPEGFMEAKTKSVGQVLRGGPAARQEADLFTDRAGRKWRYLVPKKYSNPEESGIIAKVSRGSNTMNIEIDEAGNVRINQ